MSYQTIVGLRGGVTASLSFRTLRIRFAKPTGRTPELLEGNRPQFQIDKEYLRKDWRSIGVSNKRFLCAWHRAVPPKEK